MLQSPHVCLSFFSKFSPLFFLSFSYLRCLNQHPKPNLKEKSYLRQYRENISATVNENSVKTLFRLSLLEHNCRVDSKSSNYCLYCTYNWIQVKLLLYLSPFLRASRYCLGLLKIFNFSKFQIFQKFGIGIPVNLHSHFHLITYLIQLLIIVNRNVPNG